MSYTNLYQCSRQQGKLDYRTGRSAFAVKEHIEAQEWRNDNASPELMTLKVSRPEVAVGLGPESDYLSKKLVQLRVGSDPHLADKMGPWYHIFGVLHLSSVAKGGRWTAKIWAEAENLLRHAPGFSSGPDYFKE